MKKYEYISGIKTVCMLIVILSHCMLFYGEEEMFPIKADFSSPTVVKLCLFLDVSIMAAFVFCSGFLYAAGLKKGRSVKEDILSRIKRLLLPYYLYGALCLVPVYTLLDIECFGRPAGTGLIEGYKEMILGVFSDHLWFLWMLFWISLFFILIKPFLEGKKLIIAGLLSAAFMWVDMFLLKDFPYFKVFFLAPYVMCFFAGVLFFYLDEKINKLPPVADLLIAAALFLIVLLYSQNKPDNTVLFYVMKAVSGIMFYFLFVFLAGTALYKNMREMKLYRYFEKNSMSLYIFCYPTAYIYFKLLYPYIGQNVALCVLLNMVLTIATIAVILDAWDKIGIKKYFKGIKQR